MIKWFIVLMWLRHYVFQILIFHFLSVFESCKSWWSVRNFTMKFRDYRSWQNNIYRAQKIVLKGNNCSCAHKKRLQIVNSFSPSFSSYYPCTTSPPPLSSLSCLTPLPSHMLPVLVPCFLVIDNHTFLKF